MKTTPSDTGPTLPDLLKRYKERTAGVINFDVYNQMVHTHHSTAIEGSRLTFLETQTLIKKDLTAGGKPLEHHLRVIDYQTAKLLILKLANNSSHSNNLFSTWLV